MADVTIAAIEEMEPIYDGVMRRARATLGVTAWGMQVLTLPANWDGYPNHNHERRRRIRTRRRFTSRSKAPRCSKRTVRGSICGRA
jgi:hypothetical protein